VRDPATLPAVGHLIALEILEGLSELAGRIKRVEEQLELFTAEDSMVAYLRTWPCTGAVTAWVLRGSIGDVTRFKNGKQLAHYCGLSPANASSGQRVSDAGLVASGNKLLRSTLIELAHRLRRQVVRWKAFGAGLKARGKAGSAIAAAIANRFIRQGYYPWKQAQETGVWQEPGEPVVDPWGVVTGVAQGDGGHDSTAAGEVLR
jgi:transposase